MGGEPKIYNTLTRKAFSEKENERDAWEVTLHWSLEPLARDGERKK